MRSSTPFGSANALCQQVEDIDLLRSFNAKVARLEQSQFAKRFQNEIPEVLLKFEGPIEITPIGDSSFNIFGKICSWVPTFNQDEIDAFVLTYRMLTQANDRLSIANLAKVYERDWMPRDAAATFRESRQYLNDYLDSPATIEFGTSRIAIRQVVDTVLYGGLAHSNKVKSDVFESWAASPALSGLIWVEFMAAMAKALYVFVFFRQLNEAVIDAYRERVRQADQT